MTHVDPFAEPQSETTEQPVMGKQVFSFLMMVLLVGACIYFAEKWGLLDTSLGALVLLVVIISLPCFLLLLNRRTKKK